MSEKCCKCGSTKKLKKVPVTGRYGDSCVTMCINCFNRERFPKLDEKRRRLIAQLDEVITEMAKIIAEAHSDE